MNLIYIFIFALFAISGSHAETLKCKDWFIPEECFIENQNVKNSANVTIDPYGVDGVDENVTDVFIVDTILPNSIPEKIFTTFPNVNFLQLRKNGLMVWKSEYLAGASNLRRLEIDQNPITHFDEDAFNEVPILSTLWITHTKMTTLNSQMFSAFTNLKQLSLAHQNLSQAIQVDTFDEIKPTLLSLTLSFTSITKIPKGMFKDFNKLKHLMLVGTKELIGTLDANATLPPKLEVIFIGKVS